MLYYHYNKIDLGVLYLSIRICVKQLIDLRFWLTDYRLIWIENQNFDNMHAIFLLIVFAI